MTSYLSDFLSNIFGSDTILDMIGQSIRDFISKFSQKSFSPKVCSFWTFFSGLIVSLNFTRDLFSIFEVIRYRCWDLINLLNLGVLTVWFSFKHDKSWVTLNKLIWRDFEVFHLTVFDAWFYFESWLIKSCNFVIWQELFGLII